MQLIAEGPVKAVVVTDSLPLPLNACDKVVQVSVASMLGRIMVGEHFGPYMDEEMFQRLD